MKKQFYLLPVLMLLIGNVAMAQLPSDVVFPEGAINSINTYGSMDGQYGDASRDPEGLVQGVFCYGSDIELDAVQVNTGEVFASYEWFLLDKDGNELGAAFHTGNGTEGQSFSYNHERTGYHRFRVYGYNAENQDGCFEITDVAVYVFPQIVITEDFTPGVDEFCENVVESLDLYNNEDAGVVLNAGDLEINPRDDFNSDQFELNYEWFIIKDGNREPLTSGDVLTYRIGAADNDLDFTLGNVTPGTYAYGVRAYYIFEGEEICGEEEGTIMYNLTITEAPAKPVIRINGAANSRQQQ